MKSGDCRQIGDQASAMQLVRLIAKYLVAMLIFRDLLFLPSVATISTRKSATGVGGVRVGLAG